MYTYIPLGLKQEG